MAGQLANRTAIVTGASSGVGRAIAELFGSEGAHVFMVGRTIEPMEASKLKIEQSSGSATIAAFDLQNVSKLQDFIEQTANQSGQLDILVNNAGYALVGAFEACSSEEIEREFATNVFGLMAVTRARKPHFRERRQGTLVNIASIAGRMAFPLYSPYHATKWAVEGFSESLQYELKRFNIKVKIIEPGPIKTDFYARSMAVAQKPGLTDYDDYVASVLPQMQNPEVGSPPSHTAQVIYRAVCDGSWKLRYPAGGNAGLLLAMRKLLPDALFQRIIKSGVER